MGYLRDSYLVVFKVEVGEPTRNTVIGRKYVHQAAGPPLVLGPVNSSFSTATIYRAPRTSGRQKFDYEEHLRCMTEAAWECNLCAVTNSGTSGRGLDCGATRLQPSEESPRHQQPMRLVNVKGEARLLALSGTLRISYPGPALEVQYSLGLPPLLPFTTHFIPRFTCRSLLLICCCA